jgi:hypothetical protein
LPTRDNKNTNEVSRLNIIRREIEKRYKELLGDDYAEIK